MKKLFVLIGIIAMITLASCSKEKSCKCTTTTTGMPDATQTMTIQDGDCEDMNLSQTTAGITQTVTCVEQ